MNDNASSAVRAPLPDGFIIIDKHAGATSHDVVNSVRKLFMTKQVGHTGTLDPMATGVMCVLVGRTVKASEYVTAAEKRYTATLRLGVTTDTGDITGSVLSSCSDLPGREEVEAVLSRFVGNIMQVPPMYSALKRGGHKLADLARKGIEVEREARPISVEKLEIIDASPEIGEYTLDIKCSKGTYVRVLCEDIGASLGCGGTMASLRRTESGIFTLDESVTVDDLARMSYEERCGMLHPCEELFDHFALRLSDFYAKLACCGNEIYLKKTGVELPCGTFVRLYDKDGFFALGQVREFPNGYAVKPVKQFRLN